MPCNVLQPPSTSPLFPHRPHGSSFSLRAAATLSCPSPSAARGYHPAASHPSSSLPTRRGSIEIQFPPTHPSHLPSALFSATAASSSSSSSTSPVTSPQPPRRSGDPQHPGKEATGCIPCDKLRGSIIHGNLQAPLFKRRPSRIACRPGCRQQRNVNTKTGDFKWPE